MGQYGKSITEGFWVEWFLLVWRGDGKVGIADRAKDFVCVRRLEEWAGDGFFVWLDLVFLFMRFVRASVVRLLE